MKFYMNPSERNGRGIRSTIRDTFTCIYSKLQQCNAASCQLSRDITWNGFYLSYYSVYFSENMPLQSRKQQRLFIISCDINWRSNFSRGLCKVSFQSKTVYAARSYSVFKRNTLNNYVP